MVQCLYLDVKKKILLLIVFKKVMKMILNIQRKFKQQEMLIHKY